MRQGRLVLFAPLPLAGIVRRVALLVACLSAFVAPAAGQPAPGNPAAVTARGRIVAEGTGELLRRARVSVALSPDRVDTVLTDDEGRFAIALPPTPRSTLAIAKAGYATTDVTVTRAAAAEELLVRLPRGAAIVGRAVDAGGTPMMHYTVAVRRVVESGAPEELRRAATDDLGEYRIGGLPAGRYALLVAVTPTQQVVNGKLVTIISASTRSMEDTGQQFDLRPGDTALAGDIGVPGPVISVLMPRVDPRLCPGTSRLRVAVAGDAGNRLAGASVRVEQRTDARMLLANRTTDETGVVEVDCLLAGEYTIEVSRPGYTLDRFGDRRALRMAVGVGDNEVVDAPTVVMRRDSALSGSVVDEHGEPVQGASVAALAVKYSSGRVRAAATATGQTDDRGRYRLFGLAPGAYLLSAAIDATTAAAATSYAPIYFPGTPDISGATPVVVEPGRDGEGLTIALAPSTAVRVTGVALDRSGAPVQGRVRLTASQRSGAIARDPLQTFSDVSGEFWFTNVPPGEYVVHVTTDTILGPGAQSGFAYVTVGAGEVPPIRVDTVEKGTVSGTIGFDDGEQRSLGKLLLKLMPVTFDETPFLEDGRPVVSLGDGTFYARGVHGIVKVAMADGPAEWYVKALRSGGVDVTDTGVVVHGDDVEGLEIVLSARGASLAGRSDDENRRGDYAVVVFSVDRGTWGVHSRHMKMVTASPDGSFLVAGLPPGDYWAIGIDALDVRARGADWPDPAFLERLSAQATRVTLEEGEQRTATLPVASP